ncbi:hypothetical protein O181_000976 [Austropuccinia psidii MF-1]|uniref:Reverse transcriptase Ty1/copia-type domain-containing protein n=1 Tax=Austropuccinia psidii MF-1 TaxID=1389203 RepID=A0A9Q3GC06_9BASI|nr:hypothetical protein [Austropuccinia psidii MF-1]
MPYREGNRKDLANGDKEEEDEEPIVPVKEITQKNEDRTTDVPEITQRDKRREPLVILIRISPAQNEFAEEKQPDQEGCLQVMISGSVLQIPVYLSKKTNILFAWVEDILVIGRDSDAIIDKLKGSFKIKDLGLASHVLGIEVIQMIEDSIQTSQTHYIEELVRKYNMEDCKPTMMPMQSNLKLEATTQAEIDELKNLNLDCRSAVGSLNYLSICTCPDIAYVVGHLSQLLERPSTQHLTGFKRVLR